MHHVANALKQLLIYWPNKISIVGRRTNWNVVHLVRSKKRRRRWNGHVNRMPQTSIPDPTTSAVRRTPGGTRERGIRKWTIGGGP